MDDAIKWGWRNASRLYRKHINPEDSARQLVDVIGLWWCMRHGLKREWQVKVWNTGNGWYCVDLVNTRTCVGIEVKGGYQKYYVGDVARDQKLKDLGWTIVRVSTAELSKDPKGWRRKLRTLLKD